MLAKVNPTTTKSWQNLHRHFEKIKKLHMRDLFAEDPQRFKKFSIRFNDLMLDYSKNRITEETIRGLIYLAEECDLKNAIENTPDEGRVEIVVKSKGEGTLLEVRDFGVGITPESQIRIFEGFFSTRETMDYSSKKPFDFNAGGKGADLLRMKIFSERYDFKIELISSRCASLPQDSDTCPGRISTCPKCKDGNGCHQTIATDNPAVQKLARLHRNKPANSARVLLWIRIYRVPDFVFFSHVEHVGAVVERDHAGLTVEQRNGDAHLVGHRVPLVVQQPALVVDEGGDVRSDVSNQPALSEVEG